MKYLLAHKFIDEDPFYVRIGQTSWDEILDPRQATLFSSEKEALDWDKNNTTFSEHMLIQNAEKAIKDFEEKLSKGWVRRTINLVDNNFSRPYNNESPEEILKWQIRAKKLKDDDSIRSEDYKTWPSLYEVFNYLFSVVAYWNEDDTDISVSVDIAVRPKKADFETFKKELLLALPYITKIEKGYKVIDIFDDGLCADGGAYFYYKNSSDCYIEEWGGNNKHKFHSLDSCFEWWKKNRPYSN